MNKPAYQKINNLCGWLIFIIASSTFLFTREATASWWDCGEFLSAAYKLQVVHEPGSPLFLLIGRMFSFLATSPATVASMINASSALASGATILFLYWSITALARKLILKDISDYTLGNVIAVMGAGLVGSLAYCWSDTFWFSAVESEVYALSSFCTALVFWAILKWEVNADQERSGKWLLFIAYVMGLSIGVHLLNLLTIPAICYVYYFKRHKPNLAGGIITGVISIFILAGILYGLIPGMIKGAASIDLFAVNRLNLPFNYGAFFFFIVSALLLASGIWYTNSRKKPLLNAILLGVTFILIGYASYAMVIIRAKANTPLNNSKPADFISLLGYLGREQYQDSPLAYGQNYTARVIKVDQGEMRYRKGLSRYDELGPKPVYVYDPVATTLFPRIWDSDHANDYRIWLGLQKNDVPSFADNLSFFFSYQLNYMYWRYFMWNFAGRQNDAPSAFPNPTKGNWLSGLKFTDAARLGNQQALPKSILTNKAYNRLFYLPLFLGLLGLYFQFRNNKLDFLAIFLLFLFTGIAIAVYLNMPPSQPRERDYAFAGSFYAFTIWIGLGVLALYKLAIKRLEPRLAASGVTIICFLAVPILMACQEYNDHDRSTRYTTRDFAANYLNTCAPNSILFAYGDNETYPLWYAQEVEGIRTDVRVINLSLFDASWCIDNAKLPINKSAGLPITWKNSQYADGTRDYISYTDKSLKGYTELRDILDFTGSDDPASKNEDGENYLPTRKFKLTVDPAQVISTGTVPLSQKNEIVKSMEWTFNHNSITKGQLIILDMLAQNKWKRPVYFCATMGADSYMGMDAYLQQEGIAYRLVPVRKDSTRTQAEYQLNQPLMYHNLMDNYKWGNLNGNIHIDDQTNSFAASFKDLFVQLATSLYTSKKLDSCRKVLDRCVGEIPTLPPLNSQINDGDFADIKIADLYYDCGETLKANRLMTSQLSHIDDELNFAKSQGNARARSLFADVLREGDSLLDEIIKVSKKHGQTGINQKASLMQLQENARLPAFE